MWRVFLARSGSEWRIRFEQPQETQAPSVAVVTAVPVPLPAGTVLRTLVAQAVGYHA